MKPILTLLLSLALVGCATSPAVHRDNIRVAWDPVAEADGYLIYVDGRAAAATQSTAAQITWAHGSTAYVVATNATATSGPSNIITNL